MSQILRELSLGMIFILVCSLTSSTCAYAEEQKDHKCSNEIKNLETLLERLDQAVTNAQSALPGCTITWGITEQVVLSQQCFQLPSLNMLDPASLVSLMEATNAQASIRRAEEAHSASVNALRACMSYESMTTIIEFDKETGEKVRHDTFPEIHNPILLPTCEDTDAC